MSGFSFQVTKFEDEKQGGVYPQINTNQRSQMNTNKRVISYEQGEKQGGVVSFGRFCVKRIEEAKQGEKGRRSEAGGLSTNQHKSKITNEHE